MTLEVPACVRVRLRPDSLAKVREWAAHINDHRSEAMQTLIAEGVRVESVFLDSSKDGDFLVCYMRAVSHAVARKVAQDSTARIDAFHRAFKKETWVEVSPLELLVDLQAAQ